MSSPAPLERAFADERRLLWALCYRMTGCAADADDVVQETFARALARPPRAGDDEPLRPWLVKVALNLGRDLLRRRRRRGYVGPWLPSPVPDEAPAEEPPPAHEPPSAEGRYDLVESASFAFLLALEALTPRQRAVLLLLDVFDYSVKETAAALDLSEANVKTTHHRARAALRGYRDARLPPTVERRAETRRALERFLAALAADDVAAVEAMLADDVRGLSDGGGEYQAARLPVVGRKKVALFYTKLTRARGAARFALRDLGGLPTLIADYDAPRPGEAPRVTLAVELDRAGKIARIYSVLASRKLTAV